MELNTHIGLDPVDRQRENKTSVCLYLKLYLSRLCKTSILFSCPPYQLFVNHLFTYFYQLFYNSIETIISKLLMEALNAMAEIQRNNVRSNHALIMQKHTIHIGLDPIFRSPSRLTDLQHLTLSTISRVVRITSLLEVNLHNLV